MGSEGCAGHYLMLASAIYYSTLSVQYSVICAALTGVRVSQGNQLLGRPLSHLTHPLRLKKLEHLQH